MIRTDSWQVDLFQHLNDQATKPHVWGQNDCVTFCADAVKIMTGEDPIGDLRGGWDSPLSAARKIKELGFGSLSEAVAAYLKSTPMATAKRGDVVLCDDGNGTDFLAVITGHMAVAPAPHGMLHIPRNQWLEAYQIG